jgi:broad specificity phosphatase PhoE
MKICNFIILFFLFMIPAFSIEPKLGGVLTESLKEETLPPLHNKCRIIILRHGETQWNVEGKSQGWTDIPLNEEGRRQSYELAMKLSDVFVKTFYSSALSRAVETTKIIASVHQDPILILDPALRFYKQDRNTWFDFLKTKKRKKALMRKEVTEDSIAYLKMLSLKHPGETIVVVTHGRVLKRVLIALSNKKSSEVMINNGGIARIIGDGETLYIEE